MQAGAGGQAPNRPPLPAADLPEADGLRLAVLPTVESLVAQALAAMLVIGSYLVAEKIRVKRPRRAGVAVEPAG